MPYLRNDKQRIQIIRPRMGKKGKLACINFSIIITEVENEQRTTNEKQCTHSSYINYTDRFSKLTEYCLNATTTL